MVKSIAPAPRHITGRSSRTRYNGRMRLCRPALLLPALAAAASLLAACGGESSIKPSEVLDERTGMTVGTLDKPIELVQGAAAPASTAFQRRQSFAYLGPVEWDNMGNIAYGLWIHVAPGNDWRFEDIQARGAVSLSLDDVTAPLSVIKPPALSTGGLLGRDRLFRRRSRAAEAHGRQRQDRPRRESGRLGGSFRRWTGCA
jgi:hypothetical protein